MDISQKHINEHEEMAHVNEPEALYAVRSKSNEEFPVMSMEEVLRNALSLEESRRLVFERIYQDFHK